MHDLRSAVYRAPAAALARVLHAHAHRRGAVADRERHRRRRDRRHLDRDVDRLERDDRARDRRRDVPPRLAARRVLARAAAALRPASRAASASERRRITTDARRGRWPTCRRWSRSRCRSPGSCSARRWAARAELADRFERRVRASSPTSRCAQRMAGRWVMASIQTSFAIMPALVYWFARPELRSAARSRSAPSSPSRRCRRASSSRSARCSPCGSTCRPRSRSSTASSSTSTCRSTSPSAPTPSTLAAPAAARSRSSDVWFRYDADGAAGRSRTSRFERAGRHDDRDRRRDRLGQDDARLPGRAPLRRRARARSRSTASTSAT